MSNSSSPRKLNVGCGRNVLEGWINMDSQKLPGIDVIADLDRCRDVPLPFEDNSIDTFLLSHVIEHIHDQLSMMQELHRIAKPGAIATVRTPYGSSDDAFEDPTHVRQMFLNSFGYFSQPFYWRADYGYRGDWKVNQITLIVSQKENAGLSGDQILQKVHMLRNVVREMVVELVAVKPIREPLQELQSGNAVAIELAPP
jgi:SAM-dependent methyltransferase